MAEEWESATDKPDTTEKWEDLWRKSYAQLWHQEEKWGDVERRRKSTPPSSLVKAQKQIDSHYPHGIENSFQRLDRDLQAGSREETLARRTEHTIHLGIEKNNIVVTFIYPKALHAMFGKDADAEIANLIGRYAMFEPPEGCDTKRTPTQHQFWLKQNRRFQKGKPSKASGSKKSEEISATGREGRPDDVSRTNEGPESTRERFSGTYHWGAWHEKKRRGPSDPVRRRTSSPADCMSPGSGTNSWMEP